MTKKEEKAYIKEQLQEIDYVQGELENLEKAIDAGNYYFYDGGYQELGEYMWDNDIIDLAPKKLQQQLKFVEYSIDYEELGERFANFREMIELPEGGFVEII